MTNYSKKSLDDTLKAINLLRERGIKYIDTKKIRQTLDIKSNEHSKISFIWRALKHFREKGVLKEYGSSTPKRYEIVDIHKPSGIAVSQKEDIKIITT